MSGDRGIFLLDTNIISQLMRDERGVVAQRARKAIRRGTPIGGNDSLIAAHALALEATLVTGNEPEFLRVPGLRVENWLHAA